MTGVAAAIIVSAVLGAGAAVYTGEQGRRAASKGRRLQEAAQRTSLLAALRDEKLASQAENRLNRRRPDVASLLFDAKTRSQMGPASTVLAGRGGGHNTLLGSKSTLMGG